MSFNLAELETEEKNRIELDKQAAYVVWKLKQGKAGPDAVTNHLNSIRIAEEQTWFQQCIEKYKRVMSVL